jgi:hypothetical protein
VTLNYVTLTGTLPGAGGAEAVFTPSGWRTDTTDELLFPPGAAAGHADACRVVQCPAAGHGQCCSRAGGVDVDGVRFDGIPDVAPYSFSFALPYAGAPVVGGVATQDISKVAVVVPSVGMAAFLLLTGGTMTGPLTLAGSPPLQIPAGAATGYVLRTDAEGNVTAQPPSFAQPFTSQSTVTVTHGLGKLPGARGHGGRRRRRPGGRRHPVPQRHRPGRLVLRAVHRHRHLQLGGPRP